MTTGPFILEDEIANGNGPRTLVAMLFAFGISYDSDHIFIQPDPSLDVIGALLQERTSGKLRDMLPIPFAWIAPVVSRLRKLTRGVETDRGSRCGWIPIQFGGMQHLIGAVVFDVHHATLFFPPHPFDREAVIQLLRSRVTADGMMEFHDDELEG